MPCLDTGVLIELMGARGRRRQEEARSFLASRVPPDETLTTTRVTEAELLVGVELSDDRELALERMRKALARTSVLEFDEAGSARFGKIKAYLLDLGRPVGDMDILIASICLA